MVRKQHWRCTVKKGFIKKVAKFTGKHQCQCLFLNKVDMQLIVNKPAFTCSKPTMEIQEQCVKSVKVTNKSARTTS